MINVSIGLGDVKKIERKIYLNKVSIKLTSVIKKSSISNSNLRLDIEPKQSIARIYAY